MNIENAIAERGDKLLSTAAACSRPGKPDRRRARAGRRLHRRRAPGACGPSETKTAVGRPISRAAARPAASATFEITTAISTPFSRPARIDSAMARKLEPRPESRMPRRVGREACKDIPQGLKPRVLCGCFGTPKQAVTKLAEADHFWRVETAGAKARPYFSMPCGPTKVVPFYKARFQLRFVTGCKAVPFQSC